MATAKRTSREQREQPHRSARAGRAVQSSTEQYRDGRAADDARGARTAVVGGLSFGWWPRVGRARRSLSEWHSPGGTRADAHTRGGCVQTRDHGRQGVHSSSPRRGPGECVREADALWGHGGRAVGEQGLVMGPSQPPQHQSSSRRRSSCRRRRSSQGLAHRWLLWLAPIRAWMGNPGQCSVWSPLCGVRSPPVITPKHAYVDPACMKNEHEHGLHQSGWTEAIRGNSDQCPWSHGQVWYMGDGTLEPYHGTVSIDRV